MPAKNVPTNTIKFPADTVQLEALGAFIQSNCADHPQVILLELAVVEVVTNAIRHGHAKECRVSVLRSDETFHITIEDDGEQFDITDQTAKPMGDLREGGYGVAIIQQTSKAVEYSFQGGWNILTLTFQGSPLLC
jgi:anti-sigma regulatory factor (Ser/Thr protein kinase)